MATVAHSIRMQSERRLRIEPQANPLLHTQVFEASEIASRNCWLELVFSAGIAIFGPVLNSPAVGSAPC